MTLRVVYETSGKAREYFPLATAPYRGCGHGCSFCYGPATLHLTREEFGRPRQRPTFLAQLLRDCQELQGRHEQREILLSFTTDPYQPLDQELGVTRDAIQMMVRHGLRVAVLTKAGAAVIRDMDLLAAYRTQCRFGVTLTCASPERSRQFEPHAGLPQERLNNLRTARALGIPTFASCEPVLFCEDTLEMIRRALPHCDDFKIGKLNYPEVLMQRHQDYTPPGTTELRMFCHEAREILEEARKRHYFKDSMLPYLEGVPRASQV